MSGTSNSCRWWIGIVVEPWGIPRLGLCRLGELICLVYVSVGEGLSGRVRERDQSRRLSRRGPWVAVEEAHCERRKTSYVGEKVLVFLRRLSFNLKGTWHPALGHTWKNRAGRAATLDHLISWNLTSPYQGSPVPRWTDGPGNEAVGCAGMKYDHAQLLIAVDTFTLPTPPPLQPGGSRPQRQVFDHVLFETQLPKWKRAVQTLLEPTPEEGEPTSGQAIFERHQSDCQRMLGAVLWLQSRAQAARRRAHERPADRSKAQCIALKDIQLYTCALKETVESQTGPLLISLWLQDELSSDLACNKTSSPATRPARTHNTSGQILANTALVATPHPSSSRTISGHSSGARRIPTQGG